MSVSLIDQRSLEVKARTERDRRLAASDWTQVPDAPLTDAQRSSWAAYRQALREVPQQDGFPHSIKWPDKPE